MRLISWNCRGLGNLRSVRDLNYLVEVHKPSILFLMETKIQKYQMEMIRSRLGFKNLFSVEGVGKSGGLVVLWDDESRL